MTDALTVLGVPVARLSRDAALTEVAALLDRDDKPATVVYANAHSLNVACTDQAHRDALRAADLVLADGSGLALAARIQGTTFPDNLNGTDFTPLVLDLARDRGLSVFLLGGDPALGPAAADALRRDHPGLRIAGHHPGYFPAADCAAVADRVRACGADVLLAAMGNPTQEVFLHTWLPATGAGLGVAVGAFLQFRVGTADRAPAWMRRLGIEWVHRLVREPRRLWRRYVLGNPLFVARVVTERVRRS